MRHDLLADVLSAMTNAVSKGKPYSELKFSSKLAEKVLDIFKAEGFIESYEKIRKPKPLK